MNSLPKPFAHNRWELLFLRAGLAIILILSLHSNWPGFTDQPKPNGLAHLFDFSFFGEPEAMKILYPFYLAALALYTLGSFMPLALAFMTFFTTGVGTLMNSQGAIGHSTQLLAMIVLAQFLVHTSYASLRLLRGPRGWLASPASCADSMDWSRNVIAAAYVVCGVVKLVNSKGLWIWNTPNLSLQLIKTNEMDYYNRLATEVGFWANDFPEILVEHPWFAQIFFGGGLFIELFAFVALLGKKWAFFGGLAIVALHLSISQIMRLNFEEHMAIVGLLLIAPWPLSIISEKVSRMRPKQAAI